MEVKGHVQPNLKRSVVVVVELCAMQNFFRASVKYTT